MPRCKNCHRTIARFDSDICPYCGESHPIDQGYPTMDVTHAFQAFGENALYRSKTKKTACILGFLLGPFGAMYFYLGYKLMGWIECIATVLVTAITGLLLFLLVSQTWLMFLVGVGLAYLINSIFMIFFVFSLSVKDANGELLR